jgi:hypothetical protein
MPLFFQELRIISQLHTSASQKVSYICISGRISRLLDFYVFLTSHSVPEKEAMNSRDNLSWSHDSIDYGKDTTDESEDDGNRDAKNGKQPKSKRHHVWISKELLFH